MTPRPPLFLPTVGRHLVREFSRTFLLTVTAFVAIYLLVDFFDRFDDYLRHDAPLDALVRTILYKVPLVLTQVTPMAVLTGALVGLGILARQNEFVALRACGVSVLQVALPLLGLAVVLSGLVFLWNEQVVPKMTRRAHEIWSIEVKKRGEHSVYTGRQVWYHGRSGFYSINRVALGRRALYGLTIYELGQDFRPVRVVEAAKAVWDGGQWTFETPRTREFRADGVVETETLPPGFVLPETLDDFRVASVEPEEFSYRMLRHQIDSLRLKGIDASEGLVDLHLKLALPAATAIMMLLAIPLSARGTRVTNLAAAAALGLAIGFAYFVVMGFARALGQTGALPPALAAWTPNFLFALIGGALLVGSD